MNAIVKSIKEQNSKASACIQPIGVNVFALHLSGGVLALDGRFEFGTKTVDRLKQEPALLSRRARRRLAVRSKFGLGFLEALGNLGSDRRKGVANVLDQKHVA